VSYILEALKKLEQKRQRERMPDLLSFQGNVARVNKKRPLWPFIVVGLILLNAIFVLYSCGLLPGQIQFNPLHINHR
jgi:hypothetical protein